MTKAVELTDKLRKLIFINILISVIACGMLATALNTALPAVIREFEIPMTTGQWISSGYTLTMGIMMPLTAFLITRFSTRRLYISAIVVFIIGLVICMVSPNFPIMMVGRVCQASGNGILTAMAQVILLSIYPPERKGTVMGWYGLSIGAAPVIAPTLAGLVVDSHSWRLIFLAAIVIMAVSLIYALCIFKDVLDTRESKFDLSSFVLSILTFGGITLGIGNIGGVGDPRISVILPLAIGIVAGVVFVRRQLRTETPFLELRILKFHDYSISVIGSMLLYFIMSGSTIIMPLYIQMILGRTAVLSALVILPGTLAMVIVSPFAGKIFDKMGIKPLFLVGSIFTLVSNVGMVFISMNTSVWVASGLNIIRCLAIGCLLTPLITWGAGGVDKSLTAHATALLASLRTVAGSIGAAVFVGIMTLAQNNSVERLGAEAPMHGLNISFVWMAAFTVLMLLIALFGVRKQSKLPAEPEKLPATEDERDD